jgi:hypothetical protein
LSFLALLSFLAIPPSRQASLPGTLAPIASAGMPCCAEAATRRNSGANPGLSRNCDRG